MFKVNSDADAGGTSFHSNEIKATTKQLIKTFGPDHGGDDFKVSHEWIFEDDQGNVFTLYAWKDTNLYDSDYGPVNFDSIRSWHVGSKGKGEGEFVDWIEKKLK